MCLGLASEALKATADHAAASRSGPCSVGLRHILNGRENVPAPLSCVALGVRFRVLTVARRMASTVDTTVGRGSGVSAGNDPSVAALADDPAVADVSTTATDIQLNVVCRSGVTATDSDRIADRQSVGSGTESEAMPEIDAVLRTALGFGDLDHAVGVGSGTDAAAGDIDPRAG